MLLFFLMNLFFLHAIIFMSLLCIKIDSQINYSLVLQLKEYLSYSFIFVFLELLWVIVLISFALLNLTKLSDSKSLFILLFSITNSLIFASMNLATYLDGLVSHLLVFKV